MTERRIVILALILVAIASISIGWQWKLIPSDTLREEPFFSMPPTTYQRAIPCPSSLGESYMTCWEIGYVSRISTTEAEPVKMPLPARVYPNPVSYRTTFAFSVPYKAETWIQIYDVRGARVETIKLGIVEGLQVVNWNVPNSLGAGIYFYGVFTGGMKKDTLARGKIVVRR